MLRALTRALASERGQTISEYGILLALIAVALIVAITFLGSKLAAKFRETGTQIENARPY